MARISGKLTAKSLGWDRVAIGAALKDMPSTFRLPLGRIVGIVSGLKQTVDNNTGNIQTGLKGQFRGVSTLGEDGKPAADGKGVTVTAGVCYLPSGLQDMIESAYTEAGDDGSVQFGLDLYAQPATNPAGYTFDADTFIEAQESDPLANLTAQAGDDKLAVPAADEIEKLRKAEIARREKAEKAEREAAEKKAE